MIRRPVVPFFISHHGCPHQCVFCDQNSIAGESRRLPTADAIVEKIRNYMRSSGGGVVDVAFFGGTFTALPTDVQEQLLEPLKPLVSQGHVGSIRVSTRPDAIDVERVELLDRYGVTTVELGAQSLDEDVLVSSGRGHTVEDVLAACALLKERGFAVGLQLMVGLPGDSGARSLVSLERALALAPDFLRIYPALVISGTELERLYRQGAYIPLSLKEAVVRCKVLLTMAERAGVPVIRLGLQPTEELCSSGAITAGPFHPAFRQLVESQRFFDLLASLSPEGATVRVHCAAGRVSDVVGQRGENRERLFRECGVRLAAVEVDPSLTAPEVQVQTTMWTRRGHLLQDLHYLPEVA
ncbi:elongator complex protein 3 [Geobacter sp. DSM 9736]|uniref:elongator complex protein 3 n=1 Tax=Geobacter sp. DSM 9736 TaxID=1277350 RepID=UPI000B5078A4|nr:radical SAM protein [Geobacter sp. DSM 9736]SNB45083.1 Radical_SAM C-terminal domain-containing protein [Geobacter sp. DSM 9736]